MTRVLNMLRPSSLFRLVVPRTATHFSLALSQPLRSAVPPSAAVAAYSALVTGGSASAGALGESIPDKCYRWLDITGFLTRWNNRKAWVLDQVPFNRQGTPLVTEYERKQEMFVTLNASILAIIASYFAWTGIQHVNYKPPTPSYEGLPGVDGRKKDFTMTNRLWFIQPKERCKECRWLDLECKKECFTRLKAEGHKLFINGGEPLSIPRAKLEPPHSH
ncbi:hypothetical protein CSUI_010335 [Cystoisospora suis]|uniref:Uncharacterized protein n=1 Tax=Cystoisospora suis TaxID=483139 RepID=A0A2C6KHQ1_9APIC|nr:hypothetical protein CSUI_010335 [Cystoisospora suis]